MKPRSGNRIPLIATVGRAMLAISSDLKELFIKRGKGTYVVVFYEGEYFRQPPAERAIRQKNAIADHPLFEPLRKIGVDGPGIRRLLKTHSRGLIQRWMKITDVAIHEKPRGFAGFKASPAAFLIDGIQNNRTPPDWIHAHEKRQERRQWEREHAVSAQDELQLRRLYEQQRTAALRAYLTSPEGRAKHERAYRPLLAFYNVTEPHRFHPSPFPLPARGERVG